MVVEEVFRELFDEREKRIRDAIELREPDRVPVICHGIGWYFKMVPGVTARDMVESNDKFMKVLLKFMLDIQPDAAWRPVPQDPLASVVVEPTPMIFPENGDNSCEPKIISRETMKVEDYKFVIENGYLATLMKFLPELRPGIPNVQKKLMDKLGLTSDPEEPPLDFTKNIEMLRQVGFPAYFLFEMLSPFNCLTLLRTYPKMCMDLKRHPDLVKQAIERMVPEMTSILIGMTKQCDLPRVCIGVHRESATFFSPKIFDEVFFPEIKSMVELCSKEDLKVILHCDGNWNPLLERLTELPKKRCVIQLDMDTDPFKAKEVIGDRYCIDAGPMELEMATWTPEEVEDYCKKLIDIVGDGGGFILKSEISREAKPENVRAFINVAKTYGVY
jgi:uroporphyrinogen-III decarboxylase